MRAWATEKIKEDRNEFGYDNRFIRGYAIYEDGKQIIGATTEIDVITEYNLKTRENLSWGIL
ncbi:MAG: hypothetical protein K2I66_05370 [Bacteroidales bacterium]|nr:hypothetical protein [Bacteroidales bacterium]